MSIHSLFSFTKIVATLGPASATPEAIEALVREGARVLRINFSHGEQADHARLLEAAREAGRRSGRHLGVLGDLGGPKIRVGEVAAPGLELAAGDAVLFASDARAAEVDTEACRRLKARAILGTTLPQLVDAVLPGHQLLINDGAVRLACTGHVQEAGQRLMRCEVTVPGRVTTRKGINAPDSELNVPSLTDRDRLCARWAVEQELDFLALSFVRRTSDLMELRHFLRELQPNGHRMPIIAKIEKPQALRELDAICEQADALMVARGDLGVEMELAQVPVIQKQVIAKAHHHGKPVIVATQMLETMIENEHPTRAEVSDIANAIYDGADAVMLSGETSVGRNPPRVVQVMRRISQITQEDLASPEGRGRAGLIRQPPGRLQETRYRTAALAHGVSTIVNDLGAVLIVTWSQNGGTARYLSQNRIGAPIVACSSDAHSLRRMSLLNAVYPVHMERPASVEQFVTAADKLVRERRWASLGDRLVIVAGEPIGAPKVTNVIRIHIVGDRASPPASAAAPS